MAFRGIDTPGKCMNRNEMSCSLYDSEGDCGGTGSNAATLDSSTNTLTTRSKDALGFGTCRFTSTPAVGAPNCFKDDNGDPAHAQDVIEGLSAASPHDIILERDNDPPVTTISYPLVNLSRSNFAFHYKTNEAILPGRTFYAIRAHGDTAALAFKQAGTAPGGENVLGEPSDIPTSTAVTAFDIFYYSQDLAKNLEPIKNFTVDLNAGR